MNEFSAIKYKPLMLKLVIILLTLLYSTTQADIKANWVEKDKKVKLPTAQIDGIEYISINALAEFLECEHEVDITRGIGTLAFANGELIYTLFSPYVTAGDKSYNIHYDIIYHYGDFYAPVEYMIPIINRLMPDDLIYSAKDNAIGLFPALYNITEIAAQQKINGLLIEIFLTEELKYDIVKTNDYWLITTIYGGKIDTSFFKGKRPIKAIYDTKAYQFENSAQLSVRLRPKDFTFVSKIKENPLRIQISIKGEGFADTVLTYMPTAEHNFTDNIIDMIVIDPGHGGEDLGAVGPFGTLEKDIVLEISDYLQKMLVDEGFKVILTRDDDWFIPLDDRTKIANEAGADLFISIHANAAKNKKARGSIIFFLADAKTDQARAAATLENSSIKFETPESQKDYISDLDFILLDMVQNEFLKESSDLAGMIEQNMKKVTKIESRGVDQAGFFVLNKAYMPSVLIETAFLSNKKDEALLKAKRTQQDIAEAIKDAVVQFKHKYEAMR